MGRYAVDHIGEKHGSLTVVERLSQRSWRLACDCGGETTGCIHNIFKQKHASCPDCRKGADHWAWGGHGDIPQNVFRTIYHGAASRNLEFEITIEEIWDLFVRQNGKCAYTGWDIHFNATYREKKAKTASLDRIDSTKGYTIDNVQWVHRDVNKLKKNMPDLDFIGLCRAVAEHRPEVVVESTT